MDEIQRKILETSFQRSLNSSRLSFLANEDRLLGYWLPIILLLSQRSVLFHLITIINLTIFRIPKNGSAANQGLPDDGGRFEPAMLRLKTHDVNHLIATRCVKCHSKKPRDVANVFNSFYLTACQIHQAWAHARNRKVRQSKLHLLHTWHISLGKDCYQMKNFTINKIFWWYNPRRMIWELGKQRRGNERRQTAQIHTAVSHINTSKFKVPKHMINSPQKMNKN